MCGNGNILQNTQQPPCKYAVGSSVIQNRVGRENHTFTCKIRSNNFNYKLFHFHRKCGCKTTPSHKC